MKKTWGVVFLLVAALLFPSLSYARGKKQPFIVESEYFTVRGYEGLNTHTVLAKLNFDYFVHPDNFLKKKTSDSRSMVASTIDAIYLETAGVLGLNASRFHGTIIFLPDKMALRIFFRDAFGGDYDQPTFYHEEKNVIYVSLAELDAAMLAREMAHAITSYYFIAPPPDKVQEILSAYVEDAVRKSVK